MVMSGQSLSAPLVSTLLALACSNVGLIPVDAPAYSVVNKFLLPLTVPLLLFAADLRRVRPQWIQTHKIMPYVNRVYIMLTIQK